MLKIGLRFRRGDARTLMNLARRVELAELPGGADLFKKAASAAYSGEPLVVLCEKPDEANQMADAFALHGMRRPAVEPLS